MPQKEFIKNLANSFSATFLHLSMNVRFENLPLDLFNESKKYLVKEKLVKYAKKLFLSAKMMFYLISYLWLSFGRLRVRISLLGQNCTTSAYIKTILLNFLLTKLKKN